MILEEETYVEFGYYSWELSLKSGKKIVTACDECGKIRIKKKSGYCSLCSSCAAKRRNYHGANNPNWQGGNIEQICEICGKTFFTKRNNIKHGWGRFCSLKCQNEWRRTLFKGKNNPNYGNKGEKCVWYGRHHTKETKLKLSEAHKGSKNPSYGKIPSEETRHKLSESHKGVKNSNYGKTASEETRQKMREARYKNRKNRHRGKTKPELIFEEICKKYNLPFKYVGDFSLWIGPKKGKKLNPDFIEANGKKVVVEIMGRYWHSPLLNPKIREEAKLLYREKHFKKYGWKSIFIWDSDLEREDREEFVLSLFKK